MKRILLLATGMIFALNSMASAASSTVTVKCQADGLSLLVEANPSTNFLTFSLDVDEVGSIHGTVDSETNGNPGNVYIHSAPDGMGGQILWVSGNTTKEKWVEAHRECHRRADWCEDIPAHVVLVPDQWVDVKLHQWPHFTFFALENVEGPQFGIPHLGVLNPRACQTSGI